MLNELIHAFQKVDSIIPIKNIVVIVKTLVRKNGRLNNLSFFSEVSQKVDEHQFQIKENIFIYQSVGCSLFAKLFYKFFCQVEEFTSIATMK